MQIKARMLRSERREELRQDIRRDGGNDAELQSPGENACAVAGVVGKVADAGQDRSDAARNLHALRRELRASSRPLDQDGPDLFLQLLNLHRQGWLGYGALLRRAPEMQRLGKRVKIAKLTQRDIRHKLILSYLQIIRIERVSLSPFPLRAPIRRHASGEG